MLAVFPLAALAGHGSYPGGGDGSYPSGRRLLFGTLPNAAKSTYSVGGALTAGTHSVGGRNFIVHLPPITPAPVVISLHGNGGDGQSATDIKDGNPELAATHILIGPDGPESSWNIIAEASKLDDALYIGTTLVNHLATFSNVVPTFGLYGFSNGAALTNRILIENDDPRIAWAITDGSQLNTRQYRAGAFYVGGSDNAYTTRKAALTPRRVLQITGARDDTIPATGGPSVIPDGLGGVVNFVDWQVSANAYARAYGYTGGQASLSPDDANTAQASYLNGQVVAVNFKSGGHVLGAAKTRATVNAFLGSTPAGLPPPPNGPGTGSGPGPGPGPSTPACVDIGFPDDPEFKCSDEAAACNDTSDLDWYNELRQACAKTCGVCGGASTAPPPPTPIIVGGTGGGGSTAPPPPSTASTPACVDVGFPDDPEFKCADEKEACNDTSDTEWYNELRQACAKTCNACGPVTG